MVDQSRAVRRARGSSLWLLVFPLLAVGPLRDVGLPWWGWTGIALLFVATLVAESLLKSRRRLLARWGPAEARIPHADPDAAFRRLEPAMRRARVFLDDVRHRPSIYSIPWENAPLRLPLEFSTDGGDIVLRGSAAHVRQAERLLRSP